MKNCTIKKLISALLLFLAASYLALPLYTSANERIAETIIKLEKSALDRWSKGDPSGFIEISTENVTYFDPFIERRITGLDKLISYYEGIRGTFTIDQYELIDPKVNVIRDVAILTFNYISYTGKVRSRWNCSEVYQNLNGKWRIVQTHWSLTRPKIDVSSKEEREL